MGEIPVYINTQLHFKNTLEQQNVELQSTTNPLSYIYAHKRMRDTSAIFKCSMNGTDVYKK